MFFRLPTGVFTLYVKRLFSFFLFQYSFQLCNDFGMFGRQILLFSDVLLQVVKLFFLAVAQLDIRQFQHKQHHYSELCISIRRRRQKENRQLRPHSRALSSPSPRMRPDDPGCQDRPLLRAAYPSGLPWRHTGRSVIPMRRRHPVLPEPASSQSSEHGYRLRKYYIYHHGTVPKVCGRPTSSTARSA